MNTTLTLTPEIYDALRRMTRTAANLMHREGITLSDDEMMAMGLFEA